jgi:hypothetical protein
MPLSIIPMIFMAIQREIIRHLSLIKLYQKLIYGPNEKKKVLVPKIVILSSLHFHIFSYISMVKYILKTIGISILSQEAIRRNVCISFCLPQNYNLFQNYWLFGNGPFMCISYEKTFLCISDLRYRPTRSSVFIKLFSPCKAVAEWMIQQNLD